MDLIVKMTFGAHLYGTATRQSDRDLKGVYLPTREEILLGRIPKSRHYSSGPPDGRNDANDVDVEIYSLHAFIQLACEGQTVALDMLHAPQEMVLVASDIWSAIVARRNRFYTRNLKAFIGYARRQASKYGIKGSRLNAAQDVLRMLATIPPEQKLRDVWQRLPVNDYCHHTGVDPNGMRQYQVCGKTFQESTAVGYVVPVLARFVDAYGHRAKLAAQNRNVDWKALSHALRAAFQTRELLTSGTLTFPLADAPFLTAVKQGRLDYISEVAPVLEALMSEVEALAAASALPDRVDSGYWDAFICRVLEKERFGVTTGHHHPDIGDTRWD
jgi:hypothetical protein